MEALRLDRPSRKPELDKLTEGITDWDEEAFATIVSTTLSEEQRLRIITPPQVFPRQSSVVAVHWHPEFVPIPLIEERIDAMFPNRTSQLIIPTQHNVLVSMGGYTGVEIDCYSAGFDLKVQLLAHFSDDKLTAADTFKAMLAHTFKYRSSQLYEFIDSVIEPAWESRVIEAADKTGASDELVHFVRLHVLKIRKLIEAHESNMPREMLKNKILRHFFDALRDQFDDGVINHAQLFLQAVKQIVKANFRLEYFYKTEEIIEEVRGLGGGIVIPHPEQFWPILLADYDVDGIEVWNPQSQRYTEFLITVVSQQNKLVRPGRRPLLVFMGDDTHFGEKVVEPHLQDPEKSSRELGVQPAWDDLRIRKSIVVAARDRQSLIEEYKSRLN